jgi:hypothetical protein
MAGPASIVAMQLTWIAVALIVSGGLSWWAKRRARSR